MGLFNQGRGRPEAEEPRPSFVRRTWRRAKFVAGGPVASVGVNEIGRGARFIDGLVTVLRSGPPKDDRLKLNEDQTIDLLATAFSYGITVPELEHRLRARQVQTCRAAYAMFAMGCGSLLLWVYGALHMEMTRARLVSAAEFVPFVMLFFLLAFRSALMNWQLRTRRLGSPVAYLRTTDSFLPR